MSYRLKFLKGSSMKSLISKLAFTTCIFACSIHPMKAFSQSVNFIASFCPDTWPGNLEKLKCKHNVTCFCPFHYKSGQHSLSFEDHDKFVFYDLNINQILPEKFKKKCVLFNCEPFVFQADFFDNFERVYTWNDDLIDNKKFFKFYYPYLTEMDKNIPSFDSKKFCCMIASHWVAHRLDAVRYFMDKEGILDIYGRNLPPPYSLSQNYKGAIPGHHSGPEKFNTLKNYKFCLCFENSIGLKGYITEKIFACFSTGCVPVYWGAENINDYIPDDCYINMNQFRSYEEVLNFLNSISEEQYITYQNNIRKFIASEKAQCFNIETFDRMMEDMANF